MNTVRTITKVIVTLSWLAFGSSAGVAIGQSAKDIWSPTVPRTWDDAVIKNLELPLANPAYTPVHMTARFYYQIPVRTIYKTYPVYHPDREPPGYIEKLGRAEPEVVFKLGATKDKRGLDSRRAIHLQ